LRAGTQGLVITERGADLTTRAPALSAALKTKVYACEIYRSNSAVSSLRCQIYDKGKDQGSYDVPHTEWSEPDTLKDVLGAKSAQDIMARLDL
jgi:hypothetical protein